MLRIRRRIFDRGDCLGRNILQSIELNRDIFTCHATLWKIHEGEEAFTPDIISYFSRRANVVKLKFSLPHLIGKYFSLKTFAYLKVIGK